MAADVALQTFSRTDCKRANEGLGLGPCGFWYVERCGRSCCTSSMARSKDCGGLITPRLHPLELLKPTAGSSGADKRARGLGVEQKSDALDD